MSLTAEERQLLQSYIKNPHNGLLPRAAVLWAPPIDGTVFDLIVEGCLRWFDPTIDNGVEWRQLSSIAGVSVPPTSIELNCWHAPLPYRPMGSVRLGEYSEGCVLVYAVTKRESFDALVDFCAEFARMIPLPPDDEEHLSTRVQQMPSIDAVRERLRGLAQVLRFPTERRGQGEARRQSAKSPVNTLSGPWRPPTESIGSSARQPSPTHRHTFPIAILAYVPKGSDDETAWQVLREEGQAFATRISATFEIFNNSHDIWKWDAEGLACRILLNRAHGFRKDIDLVRST